MVWTTDDRGEEEQVTMSTIKYGERRGNNKMVQKIRLKSMMEKEKRQKSKAETD